MMSEAVCEPENLELCHIHIAKVLTTDGSSVVEYTMEGGESVSGMLGMLEYAKWLLMAETVFGDFEDGGDEDG